MIRRLAFALAPLAFVAQCAPQCAPIAEPSAAVLVAEGGGPGTPSCDENPNPTRCDIPETTVPETTDPPVVTTTTPAPTTTAAPTTTVAPTTTTAPPAGVMFFEDFSTPAGFYDRFDFGLSQANSDKGEDVAVLDHIMHDWEGDHSLACSGPELRRPVHIAPGFGHVTPAQVAAGTQKAQMFWWCAPGNDPAKGHLMTSTNGEGYMIAYFSPKQVFRNVSRVCWDQNTTDMDAKWINVVLAPIGDVAANTAWRGFEDLGFDPPGFQPSVQHGDVPPAPEYARGPTTNIWTPNGVGVKVDNGHMFYWEGADNKNLNTQWYRNTDKATRYRHCMIDNGNGTVTLTQQRPAVCDLFGGGLQPCGPRSITTSGAFPNGDVRVVFEDDMYDPPKRAGYDPTELTWHWDNIEIR